MVFAFAIFASAFLLFQVQFIIGKHLLPWFGGAPAVWSACQVFFQGMLLAGYAYAHALVRWADPRRQAMIHGTLLALACVWLGVHAWHGGSPLLPGSQFEPEPDRDPVTQLLGALGASVALPFLVLAANAPLLQSWHARTGRVLDRTYRLYALSNAGSLAGLLTYPFGFEAVFDLEVQAWLWSGLFLAFAVGCGLLALRAARTPVSAAPAAATSFDPEAEPQTWRRTPPAGSLLLWGLLPFAASLMLVATTNQLCQDVAVVPFLWMVPLALYLITFIVSFDRPHWYSRGLIAPTALVSLGAIYTADNTASIPVAVQLAVLGLFLLLFCQLCHGELARLRPGRAHLTLYYLVIATGGALGAAVVSLIAPAVFSDFWEFHLGAALGWLIFATAWWRDRHSTFFHGAPLHYALFVAILLFAAIAVGLDRSPLGERFGGRDVVLWFAGMFALNLASFTCLVTWRRAFAWWPGWSRLFVGATCLALAGAVYRAWHDTSADHIVVGRNFYGVVRLRLYPNSEGQKVLQLTHGNINHGMQLREEGMEMTPTTYYAPRSGVGLAISALRERRAGEPLHLGVLGLGTGTLAAYAQPGDQVRFYEINPLVIMLSRSDPAIFTFVQGSQGEVSLAYGDARLSLESELAADGSRQFDLLAVDVFSSDSIPVHLMTLEAFETYAAHLRGPDAILAIHTSNRFLDLQPVVQALARRLGLAGLDVQDLGADTGASASTWILLSRDPEILAGIDAATEFAFPLDGREVLFTDRYSNLLSILGR